MEKLLKVLLIFCWLKFSIGQNLLKSRCPAEEDPDNPVHLPHESDCGLFYKCDNGELVLFECPKGLHWSVQDDRCEWPKQANCTLDSVPTTTTESSVTTTSTPAPRLDPRCPPNEDPMNPTHLPHEYDCTLFYKCDRGYAKLFYCPPAQHWSIALDRCEWPSIANCTLSGSSTSVPITSTEFTTTTTTASTTTTTDTTTTSDTTSTSSATTTLSETTTVTESNPSSKDPRCPSEDDPRNSVHLPHEYDCSLFYKCDRGFPILQECPRGLHWSAEFDRCEWPHIANCTLDLPVPPTSPCEGETTSNAPTSTLSTSSTLSESSITTESTSPTPEKDPRCPPDEDPMNPTHLPHEYDCSLFYKCDRGYAKVIECPRGLEWSIDFDRCEWPHIANCNLPGSSTSIPITSSEPATTTITSDITSSSISTESTIVTESTASTPTPEKDPRCPPDEDPNNPTHLPHEYDCSLFYKCDRGYAKPIECPRGLHWSIEFDRCEWPHIANCDLPGSSVPTTSTEPSAITTTPTTDTPTTDTTSETTIITESTPTPKRDPRCPPDEDPMNPTHLPHEYDCSLFYKCDRGYAKVIKCPRGLEWSIEFDRCEWPHVANCNLSGSSTSVPITSTDPTTTTVPTTTTESTTTTEPTTTTTTTDTTSTSSATTTLSESSTVTESNPSTPTPKRDPRCPAENDPRNPIHLPHEYDCSLFYKCDRGFLILQECPRGLHWSSVFDRCEWPHIANCTLDLPFPPTSPPCGGENNSNIPTPPVPPYFQTPEVPTAKTLPPCPLMSKV